MLPHLGDPESGHSPAVTYSPAIYEACGFRVLSAEHQHFAPSVAMATEGEPLNESEAALMKRYF